MVSPSLCGHIKEGYFRVKKVPMHAYMYVYMQRVGESEKERDLSSMNKAIVITTTTQTFNTQLWQHSNKLIPRYMLH